MSDEGGSVMSELIEEFELLEFLRARLDEDQQAALAAQGDSVFDGTGIVTGPTALGVRTAVLPSHVARFIARHDPDRVLREVEANRRLIELRESEPAISWADGGYILRYLALPYDQHPDYRPEWRPDEGAA